MEPKDEAVVKKGPKKGQKRKIMALPDQEKAQKQRDNASPEKTKSAHKTYNTYLEEVIKKERKDFIQADFDDKKVASYYEAAWRTNPSKSCTRI